MKSTSYDEKADRQFGFAFMVVMLVILAWTTTPLQKDLMFWLRYR